jgi:hypothetical protein
MRILSSSAAALTLLFLTANAPAKAQVAFESIYAQPANMVDGFDVGARVSNAPNYGSAMIVAAHSSGAAVSDGRLRDSEETLAPTVQRSGQGR